MIRGIQISVGQRFERWIVMEAAAPTEQGQKRYLCCCQCGNERIVARHELLRGKSKSCGCLISDLAVKRNYKHGHAAKRSRTYTCWTSMIQRCTDEKCGNYPDYGGRGIRVCDRWQVFENFLVDMGEVPSGLSLDRRNNDGDCSPGNCRWATRKEQARNKRSSHLIEIDGVTRTLSEWAEIANLDQGTIHARLRYGWDPARACTAAPQVHRPSTRSP